MVPRLVLGPQPGNVQLHVQAGAFAAAVQLALGGLGRARRGVRLYSGEGTA